MTYWNHLEGGNGRPAVSMLACSLLRRHETLCREETAWQINMGHILFMQVHRRAVVYLYPGMFVDRAVKRPGVTCSVAFSPLVTEFMLTRKSMPIVFHSTDTSVGKQSAKTGCMAGKLLRWQMRWLQMPYWGTSRKLNSC